MWVGKASYCWNSILLNGKRSSNILQNVGLFSTSQVWKTEVFPYETRSYLVGSLVVVWPVICVVCNFTEANATRVVVVVFQLSKVFPFDVSGFGVHHDRVGPLIVNIAMRCVMFWRCISGKKPGVPIHVDQLLHAIS